MRNQLSKSSDLRGWLKRVIRFWHLLSCLDDISAHSLVHRSYLGGHGVLGSQGRSSGEQDERKTRNNSFHRTPLGLSEYVSKFDPALELRPTPVDGQFGTGREGRVEREEEDGLGDLVRRPPALHGNHADHHLPDLGSRFSAKRFAQDRRVDGTGRHRVDANLARKQLSGERPSEGSQRGL